MFFLLTWCTLAYVSSNYKHLERTIWYHYPAQPFLCMQPLCRAFIRSRLPLELRLRFRAQSAFKIFDPVAVPPKSDQSFSENGDKEIKILAEYLYQLETGESKVQKTEELICEWRKFKYSILKLKSEMPADVIKPQRTRNWHPKHLQIGFYITCFPINGLTVILCQSFFVLLKCACLCPSAMPGRSVGHQQSNDWKQGWEALWKVICWNH